uniref:Uncharacterized protein n=1 Tax=Peronospora matthiolae TaxID=2874970 RepID=A0AAV1U3L7_9STRA
MPSLIAVAASLFSLALLTTSSATDAAQHQSDVIPRHLRGGKTGATHAEMSQLYSAIQAYSDQDPDRLLVCVLKANSPVKNGKNYNYKITGCRVDSEFLGPCPDDFTFSGCGPYNVVVSNPKSKKPMAKSITAPK